MVPVKGAGLGEVGVLCAGVSGVADECVYPCFVGGKPAGVKVADYGGGVDEVGPVEALVWGLGLECGWSFSSPSSPFTLRCAGRGEGRKRGGGAAAY